MLSQSLIHDHSMRLASALVEIVAPCFREEEKREAFGLFYEACTAAFTHYEIKAARMESRIKPSVKQNHIA